MNDPSPEVSMFLTATHNNSTNSTSWWEPNTTSTNINSTSTDTSISQYEEQQDSHHSLTFSSSNGNHQRLQQHSHRGLCKSSIRLWQQLPRSSMEEYARWIAEKPQETRTAAEQDFLKALQQKPRRMLIPQRRRRRRRPQSKCMKQYNSRFQEQETKHEQVSDAVEHERRTMARRRRRFLRESSHPFGEPSIIIPGTPSVLFWRREHPGGAGMKKAPPTATAVSPVLITSSATSVTRLSDMAKLQECMNRMGLSSDKLRDIPMDQFGGSGDGRPSNHDSDS